MIMERTTCLRYRRRGSMYVAILGASVTVMIIGMSALMTIRVERRATQGSTDFNSARLYAQSAVDLAYFMMNDDPKWKTTQTNGNWISMQPIGKGFLSVDVVDPVNNNLQNNLLNTIVITGTGKQGDATYKMSVTLSALKGGWVIVPGSWQRIVN